MWRNRIDDSGLGSLRSEVKLGWGVILGALGLVMILSGSIDAVKSIIALGALPFVFIVLLLVVCLLKALKTVLVRYANLDVVARAADRSSDLDRPGQAHPRAVVEAEHPLAGLRQCAKLRHDTRLGLGIQTVTTTENANQHQ